MTRSTTPRRHRAPLALAAIALAAACATPATGWVRTELYLGRNLRDGGTLGTADVDAFLAREAGPRLPGWTVLEARRRELPVAARAGAAAALGRRPRGLRASGRRTP